MVDFNKLAEEDPQAAAVFVKNLLKNLKDSENGIPENAERLLQTQITALWARYRTKEVIRLALVEAARKAKATTRRAKRQARRRSKK